MVIWGISWAYFLLYEEVSLVESSGGFTCVSVMCSWLFMESATSATNSPDEDGENRFHKKDLYLNKIEDGWKIAFPEK